jgi:hypothetical protein
MALSLLVTIACFTFVGILVVLGAAFADVYGVAGGLWLGFILTWRLVYLAVEAGGA